MEDKSTDSLAKANTKALWLKTGYDLFGREGKHEVRIEKLARILGLNKSGFYHYFGDLESFFFHLIELHYIKADLLIKDVRLCKSIDPDFLNVLIKHQITVLNHMQLVVNRDNALFYEAYQKINEKVDNTVLPLWASFVGIPNKTNVALKYFEIVRDMFYSRISLENMNYPFLRQLAGDAKYIAEIIANNKNY